MRALHSLAGALLGLSAASPAMAQEQARVTVATVHSAAMEGNLEKNAADRTVYVVTPPGYDEHPNRRYPVVYFLHGYFVEPKAYADLFDLAPALSEAAAAGNEVIFVMPDGYSKHRGSFYSSSPTTGDYQAFVGRDLVAWVDANYRTIATRDGRGLAGHSMGGYGSMRVAMKYPDTFSSLYVMSAGAGGGTITAGEAKQAAADDGTVDLAAPIGGVQGILARFAAWSPDPNNPPNFIQTGLRADGTLDPLVEARFRANSLLGMLPQYAAGLKRYEAIALDVGDKDGLKDGNQQLSLELTRFGIANSFTIYDGGHGDKVKARLRSDVLPFFAKHLDRAHD